MERAIEQVHAADNYRNAVVKIQKLKIVNRELEVGINEP